jgi:hypothetical protein
MEWIVITFVVLVFVAFGVFALLFPEWVGIQGKKASEIEESHRSNSTTGPDVDVLHEKRPGDEDKDPDQR